MRYSLVISVLLAVVTTDVVVSQVISRNEAKRELERIKTEWHRGWKNSFPAECQEVIRRDSTGERHIADVMTSLGLVVEFQHSRLALEERIARETINRK